MQDNTSIKVLGGQQETIGGEENHIKEVNKRLPWPTSWERAPQNWIHKQVWGLQYWYRRNHDIWITHNDIGLRALCPHIHVMHCSWHGVHEAWGAPTYKTKLKKIPEMISMSASDKIIAVSEPLKAEIVENYPISASKIQIIENGVDKEKYRPLGIEQEDFVIGVLGHRKGKGSSFAKKISQKLKDENIDHRLSISGDIDEGKMPTFYNEMDVLLHPSNYDGYGIGVAEAIACGTPVIASESTPADFKGVFKAPLDDMEPWIKYIKKVRDSDISVNPDEVTSWEETARRYENMINHLLS